jgi:hypothetical protein
MSKVICFSTGLEIVDFSSYRMVPIPDGYFLGICTYCGGHHIAPLEKEIKK